jgi:5-methyltetrahydropteroyltriglutamate--homocysteine methyltransferase
MLTSQHRILTTHTGSLPRPAALTELYARRAEGEAIDEGALDTAGKRATRHVVRQQIYVRRRRRQQWRAAA